MITIKARNAVNASRLVKAVLLEFPDQAVEVEIVKPGCGAGVGAMGSYGPVTGVGAYGCQAHKQGAR